MARVREEIKKKIVKSRDVKLRKLIKFKKDAEQVAGELEFLADNPDLNLAYNVKSKLKSLAKRLRS